MYPTEFEPATQVHESGVAPLHQEFPNFSVWISSHVIFSYIFVCIKKDFLYIRLHFLRCHFYTHFHRQTFPYTVKSVTNRVNHNRASNPENFPFQVPTVAQLDSNPGLLIHEPSILTTGFPSLAFYLLTVGRCYITTIKNKKFYLFPPVLIVYWWWFRKCVKGKIYTDKYI